MSDPNARINTILLEALNHAWFARGGQRPSWDKIQKDALKQIVAIKDAEVKEVDRLAEERGYIIGWNACVDDLPEKMGVNTALSEQECGDV